jgi:transcriptional regulator with XRE-family HTH domain
MEAIYSRVAQELRRLRKARNLTQAELGDRVGLARTSIVNFEKGSQRMQVHTLVALAEVLEVPPGDLLPQAARTASPQIESQVETLPPAVRDWVIRAIDVGPTPDP